MQKRKLLKNGSSIGSFKIIRLMGTGGMSEMYEAHDEVLDRRVAIKRISSDLSNSAELVKIFTVIGQVFMRLNHPHVVLVYSLGEHNGTRYMVMEYVEGQSLHELIKQKGALGVTQAVSYFQQLLEGLHALHEQGLTHQDIKPKNIILNKEDVIKLVDFGIGRIEGQRMVGAIHYMAPEQIEGDPGSEASDIWSLGVNFYEALTGTKAFDADDATLIAKKIAKEALVFPENTQNKIPLTLQRMIQKMCEKDPRDRYADIPEILEDLLKLSHEISTIHVIKKDPPAPPKSFYRMALGVSLAVVGTGWLAWHHQHKNRNNVVESTDSQHIFPEEKQKVWLANAKALKFMHPSIAPGDSVYLQVSADPNFQTLVFEENYQKAPFMPKGSLGDGKYYWRLVEKVDGVDQALFEGIQFTAMTPTPPALLHPADRRVSPESNKIEFYWLEKNGFENYRVQISSGRSFENLFQNLLVKETKTVPITFPVGDFFWRVRGEESPQKVSEWSEVRSLRIHKNLDKLAEAKPAPFVAQPRVVAAAPVATPVPATPTPMPTPTPTPVPVAKPPPAKPAARVVPKAPVKAVAVKKPVRPAPKAVAKAKKAAPSKKEVAFIPPPAVPVARKVAAVESVKIDVPKLKMPPDGVSIVSLNDAPDPISFKWEGVLAADSYRLEVASDAKFKNLLHSAVLTDTQTLLTKKMPKGRVYWRIRAMQGSAKSDWSVTYSFDIGD